MAARALTRLSSSLSRLTSLLSTVTRDEASICSIISLDDAAGSGAGGRTIWSSALMEEAEKESFGAKLALVVRTTPSASASKAAEAAEFVEDQGGDHEDEYCLELKDKVRRKRRRRGRRTKNKRI